MIAKIILQQLGGNRFVVMTGSRGFVDMGNGLRMKLARNKTSANRLDIIYDGGKDLYTMRFFRHTFSKKTFEVKTRDIASYEDVYCDMLDGEPLHGSNGTVHPFLSRGGICRPTFFQ